MSEFTPLQLHHREQGFCVASHAHLLVMVWGRDARGTDLEHLAERQQQVIDTHGFAQVISVIRAGLSINVPEEVREASKDNVKRFSADTRGSATIVEIAGVRAAFFRSLVTTLTLLTRSPMPQKVFTNIDEGLDWLRSLPDTKPEQLVSRSQLHAGVYALADHFGTPAPSGP